MPQHNTPTTIQKLLQPIVLSWRVGRQQFWREVATLSALAMIVLLIEMLGRWNRTEAFDIASALTLLLCVTMAASWHRRLRLRWTRKVLLTLRKTFHAAQRWRFQWGLDLRCEPPVPRRCPPALYIAPLALLGIAVAAAIWNLTIGTPLRNIITPISYVIFVLGQMLLWSGLLIALLVGLFLPAWTVFDMVKSHTNWPERKASRVGWLAVGAYFVLVAMASTLLPNWVATILLTGIVVFAVSLPWVPRTWYPDCLWRSRAGDGEVNSISLGTLFSLQLVTVALIPLALVLIALGPAAVGFATTEFDSPVSQSLGQLTAWLASGGLLVFLGLLAAHLGVARWYDPSRHAPTSVHISGVEDKSQQQRIRESLARQRWDVRFAPRKAERTDVTLSITTLPATGTSRLGSATFELAESDLNDPQVRERITRRDVIQRRRMLMSGLESIFRRAASRKDRSGSGYWVAPHYWFVDGLTRDQFDDEDTNVMDVIPPLYYKAFPRAARHHWFEISRALGVDLIYVEDGIGFRNLRRVLRVMFERYDIDGGQQPLSDVHFAGLPKVRVMLHDYDFAEPPLKTKYPEPDYQHLGRVRILHVFRDRGDDVEEIDIPAAPDWEFTPHDAPVLVPS